MSKNVADSSKWTPGAGETGIVLYIELDSTKGSRGRIASVLHNLPRFMQSRLNLDGSRLHADLSVLYDVVNDPGIRDFNPIVYLRHVLQRLYPHVFGKASELTQEFEERYSKDFRILESVEGTDNPKEGYHVYACPEPLILEPEDWTWSQWGTLCRLCGLPPADTSRIIMNVDNIEAFVEKDFEKKDLGRNVLHEVDD